MGLPLRLTFSVLAVVPLMLTALLVLAIDSTPSVHRAADITPTSIARAKRMLEQNDPRKLKPGARRTIVVGASDLDLAANYLARQYADGGARVELEHGAARMRASVRVPGFPFPAYANVRARLVEASPLARIESLRVGLLPVPAPLARWMIPRVARLAVPEADLRAFAGVVQRVSIREDRVSLTYRWQADLPGKVRAALLSREDRERLRAYQERLTSVSHSLSTEGSSLPEVLTPLFMLAGERSRGGDPVAENRAVILAASAYITGRDLGAVVTEAREWPRPRNRVVLLNGRADLAKHFIVSAALAAKAGGPLSDAVGLYKELADARDGSGFSFADLAADRAGTRFGEVAAEERSAAPLQERVGAGIVERDLIPITQGLPEFLTEREFLERFGGVGAPAYKEMIDEIEGRIIALRLYR